MLKYAILLFGLSVSSKNVLGLECQTTDIDALENKIYVTSVQNCNTYMRDMIKKFGLPKIGLLLPASCFAMKVNTNDPSTDFVVKGCVPRGLCNFFVAPIVEREARNAGVQPTSMQCAECRGRQCNNS